MREIKFRVWKKVGGGRMLQDIFLKWLSPTLKRATLGRYNDFGDVHHLQLNDALANDKEYILMQYTGLKDKNGVEIFEGDIVTTEHYDNPVEIYYEDGAFGLGMGYLHDIKDCEVIGNIYEHSHLLKEDGK